MAFFKSSSNPTYGKLKLNADGEPFTYDLFTTSNLAWSFAYYEKNVDKPLYSKVLLDEEVTLNILNHYLKTYQICQDCKGENNEEVVELFLGVLITHKEDGTIHLTQCGPTESTVHALHQKSDKVKPA
eukprot:jgi/Psemu1/14700/gm1.14700_g